LADRIEALEAAGYNIIAYGYVKTKSINHKGGIGSLFYLPRKRVYRIQIDNTELKKNYPAAWYVNLLESELVKEC